ncbi:MAG: ATP-binding cassette domain-containing protein, partial [Ruthenibacterium sp.]
MDNTIIVALKNIVVDFDGQSVLTGLSLDIHDKEFVTFLGPSGCGKTTTLRVIGGFIEPKSGNVFFNGKDITKLPPYKRQVNTVFQKYALFPHLNVFENVAFGLRLQKKADEKEIRRRVLEMLELVGLKGFERRSTFTLSGGQQQRVAIARALCMK